MKRAKFKYYFLQVLNLIFSFFLGHILVELLGIKDYFDGEWWTYSYAIAIALSIFLAILIGNLITSKIFSPAKQYDKNSSFKVNGPRFFARALETLAYVILTKYMLGFIIQIINPEDLRDLWLEIGIDATEIIVFFILIILTIPQTLLANWARKKVVYLPKNDQESRGQAKLLLLAIWVHLIFVSICLARDIVSNVRSLNEVEELKHWVGWSIVLSIGSIWLSNIEIHRIKREKEEKNTLKNLTRSLGIQKTKTKKEETKHQDLIDGIKHELGNHLSYSLTDLDNLQYEINDDPRKYESITPIITRIDNSISKAKRALKNLEELFDDKMSLKQCDLFDVIQNLIGNNRVIEEVKKEFNVEIKHAKPNFNVIADVDKEKLDLVFDNLFKNAAQHSFKTSAKNSFNILITYIDSVDTIDLVICSDGDPFPESMSDDLFITKNESTGGGSNSGFGGYLIGKIMANHQGSVSIRDRSSEVQSNFDSDIKLLNFVTLTFPKVYANGTDPDKSTDD